MTLRTARPVVLVADDHAGIRQLIDTLLTMEGYEVIQAANGVAVFEVLAARRPDVILLDLAMPQLDGWKVMGVIREQQIHIPVVIVAATLHAAEYAAELGAEGSLVKPFAAADLKRVVRQVLRASRETIPAGLEN
jgi:CheY-like chemotaxis protein